jgi:hypothetical protein
VVSTISANPDRSGGASDVAFFNSKSISRTRPEAVSVLPVTTAGAARAGHDD